ncbi:MAG: hypothetical protein ACW964_02375 [Candidatus Hodarchaeales archaeon]
MGSYNRPEDVTKEITDTIIVGEPSGRNLYTAGCEQPYELRELVIRYLGITKALND